MKLTSILSLTVLTSVVSAGSPCGMDKHPGVLNAIGKFCQNQGIMVPSNFASSGMSGAYDGGHISITGSCSPAQWVPQEYCMSQFQQMCSNTRKVRRFGRNGCQTWRIKYPGEIKAHSGKGQKGAVPSPQKPAHAANTVTRNL